MTSEPTPASPHTHPHTHAPVGEVPTPHAEKQAPPSGDDVKSRWQRLRGLLAMVLGLAASVLLLRQVDPHQPGVYPVCPTKVLTGFDCPGCGGLRATHELAHGDIAAAVDDNALVVLAVPLAVWVFARAFYFAWTGHTPASMPAARARWLTITAIVVLTLFTVVRNIPGSFFAAG